MIPAILAAIRTQLKASITGVTVDNFPARPEDYEKIPWQRGMVLVAYKGRHFAEPETMGLIVQEASPQFEVFVGAKSLKDDTASITLLESVRFALTGFRPAGASKMYPVSDGFVDQRNGVWVYSITFATTYDARELPPDIPPDPTLVLATNVNTDTNESFEVTPSAQFNPPPGV